MEITKVERFPRLSPLKPENTDPNHGAYLRWLADVVDHLQKQASNPEVLK